MKRIFHLDYETFSTRDLKALGAFVYSEDPKAEIMIAAIAEDLPDGRVDGPYLYVAPEYVDAGVPCHPKAENMISDAFGDPEAEIWAHNAQFESALTVNCWPGRKPQLSQWRCTAALARKAGLPASLENVAKELGLIQQKSFMGYALIRKFCIPQKEKKTGRIFRILPSDEPGKWKDFCDYCLQDVRTEIAVHRALKPIALKGFELASFQQDLVMNHRGIPVDRPALLKAKALIEQVTRETTEAFVKLTGLQPTQRDKVLTYLQKRGAKITNMRKRTLKELGDEEGDEEDEFQIDAEAKSEIREAVALYQLLSYAAPKKVASMLALVSPDDRVRGTLLWYGAGTGRSSGVKLQPQNFKKPGFKDTALAFEMIKRGATREILDCLWGNALEVVASCIRHFFAGPLFDADYNAGEARIALWLADQEDVLEMFRQGKKIYEAMAAQVFGVPAETIKNPSFERDVGKASILGCQYQLGAKGLQMNCANNGLTIAEDLAKQAVDGYRTMCYKVKELWGLLDKAAKAAIRSPGTRYWAGKKLSFSCAKLAGVPYLIMHLPSGRSLYYPRPMIEMVFAPKLDKEVEQVTYYGRLKGKVYGHVSIYGGAFLENACQATMGDVLVNGLLNAEKIGFEPFLQIHDQALTPKHLRLTFKDFAAALAGLPAWAEGLPMKVEAKETPYYQK